MKYYIQAKESRRQNDGRIAVRFVFRESGREFLASTGIMVTTPFVGLDIPPSEPNRRSKMKRLMTIADEVDSFLLDNADMDFAALKDGLTAVVKGGPGDVVKGLAAYVEEYAGTLANEGTRSIYMCTARKVAAYDGSAGLDDVDKAWLDGFVSSLGDVSVNYAAINLRNVRAVFNWAIDNEWTKNYPFRRYKIRCEKVSVNNITVEQLRSLRDYPLDDWRRMYRDLFMLTFYLCGINPSDLLTLRKEDMRNGRVRYRRMKTGRMYDIPVPEEALEIIERYRGKGQLLCPLDMYRSRKDFIAHWNAALKKIGPVDIVPDKVGRMRKMVYRPLVEGMTIYTARYTFASIGAELDIPRETIALCLGHAWTDVTSHYISYDVRKIDVAVRRIIDYVNGVNG